MKKRIVALIISAMLCMTILPSLSVFASTTIPLESGKALSASYTDKDGCWLSFTAAEDGYYKYSYTADTCDTIGGFYSKDGQTLLSYNNTGGYNSFEKKYKYNGEVYLHKGDYLLGLFPFGLYSGDTVNVAVKVEISSPKYTEDKEPNDVGTNSSSLLADGSVSGYLGGYREDGAKDRTDWFVFSIPDAGTYPIELESECEVYAEIFNAETNETVSSFIAFYKSFSSSYVVNESIQFPTGGKYYASINLYGSANQGAYKLALKGAETVSKTSVTTPKTEPAATGVRLIMPKLTSGIGWRIWRSDSLGSKGDVIAELVTSESFIDVNVGAGKTYYYTIAEISAAGTAGESSETVMAVAPETLNSIETKGKKGFILMTIDDPKMSVNGEIREIDPGRGTTPVVVNGRTLVPIRSIVEAIGGKVGWNEAARQVSIDYSGRHVEMTLGSKIMLVDNKKTEMDVSAQTINGRTVLPVRFVSDGVGCKIEWIGSTRQVVIVYAVQD